MTAVKDFNPAIIIYLAAVALFFATMLVILILVNKWRHKRRRAHRSGTTFLRDNDPRNRNWYLMKVLTGFQSKLDVELDDITVKFYGDDEEHMLVDGFRKLFLPGAADYFIITTEQCLPQIREIYVTKKPRKPDESWFLEEIIVYDLQSENNTYVFPFNDWLILKQSNTLTIPGTKLEDPKATSGSLKRRFLHNLQDYCLGFTFLTRYHSRTVLNIAQRQFYCFIMMSLALYVNMALRGIPDCKKKIDSRKIPDVKEFLRQEDAICAVITALIIIFPTLTITYIMRDSFKIVQWEFFIDLDFSWMPERTHRRWAKNVPEEEDNEPETRSKNGKESENKAIAECKVKGCFTDDPKSQKCKKHAEKVTIYVQKSDSQVPKKVIEISYSEPGDEQLNYNNINYVKYLIFWIVSIVIVIILTSLNLFHSIMLSMEETILCLNSTLLGFLISMLLFLLAVFLFSALCKTDTDQNEVVTVSLQNLIHVLKHKKNEIFNVRKLEILKRCTLNEYRNKVCG